MSPLAEQGFEIAGALLILAGYGLAQFAGIDRHGYPYLLLNAIGSGILAVIAVVHQQWGFVLVQIVWALVALWGVLQNLRRASAS